MSLKNKEFLLTFRQFKVNLKLNLTANKLDSMEKYDA